jgi:hypothetical protein
MNNMETIFFHIFHIISLFNLLFIHIFHIFSQFLLYFPNFSLFNLGFFHIFPLSELCKWVSKKRRKVSWIVKRFWKYRGKVSWISPLCTNCHDVNVILLNMALNTINQIFYLQRHIPTYLSIYIFYENYRFYSIMLVSDNWKTLPITMFK